MLKQLLSTLQVSEKTLKSIFPEHSSAIDKMVYLRKLEAKLPQDTLEELDETELAFAEDILSPKNQGRISEYLALHPEEAVAVSAEESTPEPEQPEPSAESTDAGELYETITLPDVTEGEATNEIVLIEPTEHEEIILDEHVPEIVLDQPAEWVMGDDDYLFLENLKLASLPKLAALFYVSKFSSVVANHDTIILDYSTGGLEESKKITINRHIIDALVNDGFVDGNSFTLTEYGVKLLGLYDDCFYTSLHPFAYVYKTQQQIFSNAIVDTQIRSGLYIRVKSEGGERFLYDGYSLLELVGSELLEDDNTIDENFENVVEAALTGADMQPCYPNAYCVSLTVEENAVKVNGGNSLGYMILRSDKGKDLYVDSLVYNYLCQKYGKLIFHFDLNATDPLIVVHKDIDDPAVAFIIPDKTISADKSPKLTERPIADLEQLISKAKENYPDELKYTSYDDFMLRDYVAPIIPQEVAPIAEPEVVIPEETEPAQPVEPEAPAVSKFEYYKQLIADLKVAAGLMPAKKKYYAELIVDLKVVAAMQVSAEEKKKIAKMEKGGGVGENELMDAMNYLEIVKHYTILQVAVKDRIRKNTKWIVEDLGNDQYTDFGIVELAKESGWNGESLTPKVEDKINPDSIPTQEKGGGVGEITLYSRFENPLLLHWSKQGGDNLSALKELITLRRLGTASYGTFGTVTYFTLINSLSERDLSILRFVNDNFTGTPLYSIEFRKGGEVKKLTVEKNKRNPLGFDRNTLFTNEVGNEFRIYSYDSNLGGYWANDLGAAHKNLMWTGKWENFESTYKVKVEHPEPEFVDGGGVTFGQEPLDAWAYGDAVANAYQRNQTQAAITRKHFLENKSFAGFAAGGAEKVTIIDGDTYYYYYNDYIKKDKNGDYTIFISRENRYSGSQKNLFVSHLERIFNWLIEYYPDQSFRIVDKSHKNEYLKYVVKYPITVDSNGNNIAHLGKMDVKEFVDGGIVTAGMLAVAAASGVAASITQKAADSALKHGHKLFGHRLPEKIRHYYGKDEDGKRKKIFEVYQGDKWITVKENKFQSYLKQKGSEGKLLFRKRKTKGKYAMYALNKSNYEQGGEVMADGGGIYSWVLGEEVLDKGYYYQYLPNINIIKATESGNIENGEVQDSELVFVIKSESFLDSRSRVDAALRLSKLFGITTDRAMQAMDHGSSYKSDGYLNPDYFKGGGSITIGQKYKISEGSGLDSGKIVTIVDKSKIKTDGSGIPKNVDGAYSPVDWKKEVAIQFKDGSYGTMFKNRLVILPEAAEDLYEYTDDLPNIDPDVIPKHESGGGIRTFMKGDEGMYEGDEVRVLKVEADKYHVAILDEDGEIALLEEIIEVPKEKFENQFRLFPKAAYGGGGAIEVVGKGKKGAFRKREYEGMSKDEIIKYWQERGYKLSKTHTESRLGDFEFYLNEGQMYAGGGKIDRSGNYLTISADGNEMTIALTDEGREKVEEMRAEGKSDGEITNVLFKDIRDNSFLENHYNLGTFGISDLDTNITYFFFNDGDIRSEVDDLLFSELVLIRFSESELVKADSMAKGGQLKYPNQLGGQYASRIASSPLLKYANFEDGTRINLVRLNKPYSDGKSFAISTDANGEQKYLLHKTLDQADTDFESLVSDAEKNGRKIRNRDDVQANYKGSAYGIDPTIIPTAAKGGGVDPFPYEVIIDGDYDNPKGFRKYEVAKNYIIGNYKNHDTMELLDSKKDSIMVSRDDDQSDLDFVFGNKFKNGGNVKKSLKQKPESKKSDGKKKLIKLNKLEKMESDGKCPAGMEVQSLLFNISKFNKNSAKKWAKSHNYNSGKIDVGKEYIRIRQRSPSLYEKESFRNIPFGDAGIEAIIAKRK